MKELKVAVYGVGGFAANYINAFNEPLRENVRLVGAVDPYNKQCGVCPVYDTPDALFENEKPDLVCVATPIHFHVEHAVDALERGCHVLVEKPISATTEGAQKMIAARDKAGKKLSIAFQWCHDAVIDNVKRDADAGVFGKPVSLRAFVLYPRDSTYFSRGSRWAGKKYDGEGRPIFDSVLGNATAHYLMNMLFMVGSPVERVECATYRANPIETFDTAVVKAKTYSGADIFIAVSQAAGRMNMQQPMLEYTFEHAVIKYGALGERGTNFIATFSDGKRVDYGLEGQGRMNPLWRMIDSIREDSPVGCPAEVALLHVDALEKMREVQPEATDFPKDWIREDESMLWVPGLKETLYDCYLNRTLPNWNF